jgi:hypothetical protein
MSDGRRCTYDTSRRRPEPTHSGWPRGFVPVARIARLPEVAECDLYRAIRLGRVPAIRVHGRWFVRVDLMDPQVAETLTSDPDDAA